MGRYSHFSTGFEYKFRFGVQSSTDILTFGGLECEQSDPNTGLYIQIWDQKDTNQIDEILRDMEKQFGTGSLNLSRYDSSLQGTYKLRTDLEPLYEVGFPKEEVARYILGCCIFHQLLYTETLRADFEV